MALSRKPQEIVDDSKNPLLAKHESWERVPVGDIADILNGFAFKSRKFTNDKGVPLIRIRDVGKDSSKTFYDGEYDETYLVKNGDLLVGMDGDFRAAIWKGGKALLNQRVCKISLKTDEYDFKFLSYALQPYLDAIHAETSAVTVKHLSSRSISEIPLPLPPKEQQKRIVAKIEELFSHIDAGIEALKKAKQLLKQYRQSVLKAAVTGELTKEWREANKDKLEPASQLLERILKERRKKWEEQQLEQFRAKGKMPKDDKWKEKYKDPEAIDDSVLDKLPNEWLWAKNEQLGAIQLGRQRSPKYHNGPNMRPYLRVQNIFENKIDLDDVMEMDFSQSDFEKYALKYNDILLNEGQSPELLGRPAIYKNELPGACFTNTLIRFQASDGLLPEYTLLVYRYCMHSGRFKKAGTITTNIGHLSAGRFSEIEFPLCGTLEQEEVVRIVEDIFTRIERLEKDIDVQLLKAERNKQSILASAFCGNLN